MAHVEVDTSRLKQPLYSRWHSPDRRLYTEAEMVAYQQGLPASRFPIKWWEYMPDIMPLPTHQLTPEARKGLEGLLPF